MPIKEKGLHQLDTPFVNHFKGPFEVFVGDLED